jgi:LysM domain
LVAAALVVFAAMPLAPAGASPSPAPVKYYIVTPAESLFTIAAGTLGDGSDWAEIFRLNEGRLQPDGERLTNPRMIRPGWILQLPADATGPGVQVGSLPGVASSPSASVPPTSAPRQLNVVMVGAAALLSSLTAVLALGLIRRRRVYHGQHRRPHHPQLLPAVAEPAPKPVSRSRQFVAMRLFVLVVAVPILFGVLAATTELALHGYGFFIFRSAGTGATSSNPLPSPTPHHQH